MEGTYNILHITASCAFFFTTFRIILALFRKKVKWFKQIDERLQPNTAIRINSNFHSIIAVALATYILWTDMDLSANKFLYSSSLIQFTLNTSSGFLLYDILLIIIYREEFEWSYMLHHTVSIVAFYSCATHGVFPFIALFRLLSEASSIFINIRWIVLTLKMKESSFYVWNSVTAVIVFFLVRIVTIIPNWVAFNDSMDSTAWQNIHIVHKFICVGSTIPLDCLNLYWFWKMIKIVLKVYKSSSNSNSNLIKEKNS